MKWTSDNTCSTVLSNNLVDLHISGFSVPKGRQFLKRTLKNVKLHHVY